MIPRVPLSPHDYHMTVIWCVYGVNMVCPWVDCGVIWFAYGLFVVSYGLLVVCIWVVDGVVVAPVCVHSLSMHVRMQVHTQPHMHNADAHRDAPAHATTLYIGMVSVWHSQ